VSLSIILEVGLKNEISTVYGFGSLSEKPEEKNNH